MRKLQIYQKWEDMAGYAYVMLRHIPKSERFTLGSEIRSSIWRGLKLIIKANYVYNKRAPLQELDMELKTLLALIRVAYELRIIPTKKYEELSAKLIEIGKMLGGWIKSQGQAR